MPKQKLLSWEVGLKLVSEAGFEIPPAECHQSAPSSFLGCLFLGPSAHSVSLPKERIKPPRGL